MDFRKNSKGITLIALVITIIVLLILAGVSLSLIAGEEGILNKAENAVKKYEIAQTEEKLELSKVEAEMYGNGESIKEVFLREGEITQEEADNGFIEFSTNIVFISNEKGLKKLAEKVNNGDDFAGKTVYLIDDISCGANFDSETGELLSGSAFTPIGEFPNKFCGTFNGMNYTIKDVYVNNTVANCRGIFGITQNATIQKLTIKNTYVFGNGQCGAIIGSASNTKLLDCTIEEDVYVYGETVYVRLWSRFC